MAAATLIIYRDYQFLHYEEFKVTQNRRALQPVPESQTPRLRTVPFYNGFKSRIFGAGPTKAPDLARKIVTFYVLDATTTSPPTPPSIGMGSSRNSDQNGTRHLSY